MLDTIRQLNSDRKIYTTEDPLFSSFGRILDLNTNEIIEKITDISLIEYTDEKAHYQPNFEILNHLSCCKIIQQQIFGEMAIQTGIVRGRNQTLTGTEFHQGSEVNIAITDCILLLANKYNFSEEHGIDSSFMNAFYIKKGQALELYSTTLHYTPIEVSEEGFCMVVILLKDTNTDIPFEKNSLLCKKNKWYVCHPSCKRKIEQGFRIGLTGELITIYHK